MTRQKKELNKKIDELNNIIAAEEEMGCGCVPSGFFDPLYDEMHKLEEQLAKLSHYNSVQDMYMDSRGCEPISCLPFC